MRDSGTSADDDGRALDRVGEQVRIHAGLKQLPLQGRQGPLGIVHVGLGLVFVFLALGRGLEVVGLGRGQVLFRIGAGLDQFLQAIADVLLGLQGLRGKLPDVLELLLVEGNVGPGLEPVGVGRCQIGRVEIPAPFPALSLREKGRG